MFNPLQGNYWVKIGVCPRLLRGAPAPYFWDGVKIVSALPTDTQAVTILISLLKNPKATIEELVTTINKGHKGISITMVERLLEHHGLFKKK